MRFRSDPAAVRASIAPVVTPFTTDGDVDHDSLRALVAWQLESGLHGISLGGSTGEPSAQTVGERIAAMRVTAEAIADRVPFVPGTGSAKMDETLELTQAAIDAGADIALVITPYYSRPTQEGLYEWYATVARTFPDMPIVLYNVPIRTAVDIAPETVARLRRDFPNVVGIKETTRDFARHARRLAMLPPRPYDAPVASPKDLTFKVLTGIHRAVYDLSKGKLAGTTMGMPVLKLTTVGRKSGERRTTMLTTPLVEGDDVILVASFGGDERNPAWYLNLVAEPEVEIEIDGSKRPMLARVAQGDERTRLWDAVTAAHDNYAGYQRKTERQIPVVVLSPR